MSEQIGFFEEKAGVKSMQRVISLMLVGMGCFIALIGSIAVVFVKEFPLAAGIQLFSFSLSLIVTGITSKAIAKGQEAKVLKM